VLIFGWERPGVMHEVAAHTSSRGELVHDRAARRVVECLEALVPVRCGVGRHLMAASAQHPVGAEELFKSDFIDNVNGHVLTTSIRA